MGIRYEDISQDGALKTTGMPHALGKLFYRSLWREHPVNRACLVQRVLPILSRLVLASLEGPISAHRPLEAQGQLALGRQPDDLPGGPRLLLHMDAMLYGRRGRTHDPQPEGAGEPIPVGRVHAAHVFTRPFGPPAERKVTRLEADGESLIPDARLDFQSAPGLLDLPEPVEWIDEAYQLDPVPHAFGLFHTDSNQHVNSLVYPVLFEEALVRRMATLGADISRALAAHVDLGFRKPCFAGDRVELWLRTFRHAQRWGAVGYLAPEGVPPSKAHVTCRIWMR